MKAVETRDHEIHVGKCGGFDLISTSESVRFIQCKKYLSKYFDLAGHVRGDLDSLYSALADYDLWEVESIPGPDGALILGSKLGRFRRLMKKPADMDGIIAVRHSVDKDKRFGYAIDYVSRINMALSGEGFMVSLLDKSGKVLETIDHIPEEQDVDEIVKYLYDSASILEKGV